MRTPPTGVSIAIPCASDGAAGMNAAVAATPARINSFLMALLHVCACLITPGESPRSGKFPPWNRNPQGSCLKNS
jgi:hypothetical protein